MDIIKKLKNMMEERAWSEYRLAKEASLPQSTIANIFHRNTLPSIPTLKIICDAFGITLSQFFVEEPMLSTIQLEIANDWSKLNDDQQMLVRNIIKEFAK